MYSAEEFLKSKSIEINKIRLDSNSSDNKHVKNEDNNTYLDDYNSIKEFDKMKSKVLKYALYKKRTEQEIRQKFSKELEENMLNDIIDVLKENSYIDDYNYIDRTISEYIKLKNLSIKEVRYKLLTKGIKSKQIDEYFYNNRELMDEYEEKSAKEMVRKKRNSMEDTDIRLYLLKKGYSEENINRALSSDD